MLVGSDLGKVYDSTAPGVEQRTMGPGEPSLTGWPIRPEIELERPRYSPYENNYDYLRGFAMREVAR